MDKINQFWALFGTNIFFYLQNCRCDSTYRKPILSPKFGEHENHVDVIFRRPIIGRVTIFYVMRRMDVREETAEIVTIHQLFREISREKKEEGSKKASLPRSGARVNEYIMPDCIPHLILIGPVVW